MRRSIRRSRQTLVLVPVTIIVTLLAGSPGRAIDENLTKGATNNHVFASGMWGENIDLMNGGLSLTVPIGPTYQVSADVSFQLKLAYSSKIFTIEDTGPGWGGNRRHRARSRLQGRGQAGQGFLLQIGRYLTRANSAECPNDGNRRSRLEEEGFEDSTGAFHKEHYHWRGSPDGSFLRIKPTNNRVEMPDGTRYVLGAEVQDLLEELPGHPVSSWPWCYNTNTPPPNTDRPTYDTYTNDYRGRYVTKIEGKDRDSGGQAYNYVVIDYDPNTGMKHLMKTITMYRNGVADTARAITFVNSRQHPTDPNLPALDMGYVQSVTLPVFSNDPNTVRTATYAFSYTVADIWDPYATSILYADPNNVPHYKAVDNSDDQFEKVLLLTQITFPEGYTMNFGYDGSEFQGHNIGAVQSRVLPTGAEIQYDYGMYSFKPLTCQAGLQVPCPPVGNCTPQAGPTQCDIYGPPAGYTLGVGAKRVIPDPFYPTQAHTWSYDRTTQSVGRPSPAAVVVTDPMGNDTITYFHADTYESVYCELGDCWEPHNDTWANGLTYRTEYYRGSSINLGNLLRIDYQRWADDIENPQSETLYRHTGEYKRVYESGTVYWDDGGKTTKSVNEEWDGLGNFRKVTQYGFDGLPYRIQRADYNNVSDPNSTCQPGLLSGGLSKAHCDNWIIGTKTYSQTLDPSEVILQRSEFAFDQLGRLKTQQDLLTLPAGAGTGPGDPNTGSAGDIKTEFKYEGDATCPSGAASYPTGNVCYKRTTDFGATSGVFEESYTYQNVSVGGQTHVLPYLAKRKVGQFTWFAEDREVDASSGLTRVSRDPNGVSTTFDYDTLGRLRLVDPGNIPDPNSSVTELPAVLTYPTILTTVLEQTVSTSPVNKIHSGFQFDKLGRLTQVEKRQWNGTLATQKTQYDILGRTVSQSEWLDPGQAATTPYPKTSFDYTMSGGDPENPATDPFGRVHAVTTADLKVTRTSYMGVSSAVTVEDIQADYDPVTLIDATTVYDKDAFGRLTRVISPRTYNSSPSVCSYNSSGADAYYTYDRLDRLVTVRLESQTSAVDPNCPSTSQYRSFTYDALGRQTSATNPENGTVVNLQYDAAGNLLKRKDAMENVSFYQYDAASRLQKGWLDKAGSDPNLLILDNTYDQTGFGYGAGKLTTALSYDDAGQAVLREELHYNGMNGRLSQSKRRHGKWDPSVGPIGSQAQIVMDYKYNSLGLLRKQTYPEKLNLGRTVLSPEITYANGFLTAMSDPNRGAIVDTVEYNPAGGVRKIKTRGNVETVIPPDVRNRPSSITVTKVGGTPQTHFESGTYAYDGAGNIASIGLDKFAYDSLNRLTMALMVDPVVSAKTDSLTWNYDPLGNMKKQENSVSQAQGGPVVTTNTFGIASSNRTVSHLTQYDPGPADQNTPMSYDGNGNLILDGQHEYIFDARNRLRQVHDPNGALVARYAYDSGGYRISKYEASTEMTTFYVRDASGQTLSEFRRPNKPGAPFWLKDYVYAAGRHVAMVENEEPAIPSGFVIQASGINAATDFVSLAWDANPEPDIAGYMVFRSCCSMWEEPPEPELFDVSSPALYDTNVMEGIGYTYMVAAYDNAGRWSAYAPPFVVSPGDQAGPGIPTAGAAVTGDGRVTLNWTAPTSTDLWGFKIYRKPSSSGTFQPLGAPVSASQVSFTDTTAVNDTQYDYQVKSVDTFGYMSAGVPPTPNWRVTPTDTTPPEVPQGLYALSDANSVDLYWQASVASDLLKYEVFRSPTPINPAAPGSVLADPNVAHHLDSSSVSASTQYYYRVRSKDQKGNVSALSEELVILTRALPASLPAPAILTPQAQQWGYSYCSGYDFIIEESCSLPQNLDTTCYVEDDPPGGGVLWQVFCPPWTHQNNRTTSFTWSGDPNALLGFRVYGRRSAEEPWRLWTEYPKPYYKHARWLLEDGSLSNPFTLYRHYPLATPPPLAGGIYRYRDVAFNPEDLCDDFEFRVSALATVSGLPRESVLSAQTIPLPQTPAVPENLYVPAETIDPEGCTNCDRLNPQFYGLALTWTPGGSSCSATSRGYNVYRSRYAPGGYYPPPPIRLTREPIAAPLFRVDYLPLAGPSAIHPEIGYLTRVFPGPMGNSTPNNDNSGDVCPIQYAVTSIAGNGQESTLSNHVMVHTDAHDQTSRETEDYNCGNIGGPLNTEGMDDPFSLPPPTSVVLPGPVIDPNWTWRYGPDPNSDVGPDASNWALLKWSLPVVDPNHGPANDFRLLRKRPGESQYSELVLSSGEYLDLIPGDDQGIRQFIWQMPPELACEDANYVIQSFDLYDRAGGIATLTPVPKYKLRPENVLIDGDGTLITAMWDSLPQCPTGSSNHTISGYSVMVSGSSSCGGSIPTSGYSVIATGGFGASSRTFSPPDPNSHWYAVRVDWSDGASEMNPPVCITGGGSARLLPKQEGPPEEAGWEVAELLGQEGTRALEEQGSAASRGEFTPSSHRSVGQGGSTNPAVSLYFYHLDHLGTPRVITDVNGNAVSKHKYLPYGEEMSPPPSTNTHEFTGHERDKETGLDYMLARYYSPAGTFRFASVDPSVDSINPLQPQSWNRYAYAANSPIRYLDPDGKHTSSNHEQMTDTGLNDKMSKEALKDVKKGNTSTDTNESMSASDAKSNNQHGMAGLKPDGTVQTAEETAAGTAEAIGEKVASAAEKALGGDIKGAREEMGSAMHTGQDAGSNAHKDGQQWEGSDTGLLERIAHGLSDLGVTVAEQKAGVQATIDVHDSTISAIQALGKTQGLSDAAIAKTISEFNGK